MLGANKEVFLKDYGVTPDGGGYTVFFYADNDLNPCLDFFICCAYLLLVLSLVNRNPLNYFMG